LGGSRSQSASIRNSQAAWKYCWRYWVRGAAASACHLPGVDFFGFGFDDPAREGAGFAIAAWHAVLQSALLAAPKGKHSHASRLERPFLSYARIQQDPTPSPCFSACHRFEDYNKKLPYSGLRMRSRCEFIRSLP
jgi:hypothetical protein